MNTNTDTPLPDKFVNRFGDIPALPQDLFAATRRRIDRKAGVRRAVWAVAASLVVMVTASQTTHLAQPRNTAVAEASEELTSVDSYINSSVYKENDNSYAYYEETLYQE